MLQFDFQDFQGFKERFGMQEHGNGCKSRKNKILLSFVKDQLQKKNYEAINFTSMAEMKAYVWEKLKQSGRGDQNLFYRVELMGDIFLSNLYETDEWQGICEDHDTRSIRYKNMEQSGRVYKMKAGKMLHHLIDATEYGRELPEPVKRWLEEDFTQRWTSYCMGMLPENRLIVNDDFKRIYSSSECVGCFHSCMVDQDHHPFYKNAVEAKAAFLVNEDDLVIARAILWPKVYDEDGNEYRYLDRQYSTDGNQVLMRALIDELLKTDQIDIYKVPGCGCGEANAIVDKDGKSMSHKTFHIECNLETDECLSYQDTFKWYDYNAEKSYNSGRYGYSYTLDTTSYSIDADYSDDDEPENYDEYHQEYVDSELTTVYVNGEEMTCASDWLDDFRWVDSQDEYHHKDNVIKCSRCGEYELIGEVCSSEITGKDYCCEDCRDADEKEYKEKNWYFSDFDQTYYENLSDLATFNCWSPELEVYLERTISRITLNEMVDRGLMFLFAGEYCNALDPQTNKPYSKTTAVCNS